MSTCSDIQDRFFDRLQGPLEEVDRHLQACAACAALYQRYEVLRQVGASPAPAPLTSEFFTRLELARERPDPVQMWLRTVARLRRGAAVAAAVAALVTAGWIGSGVPTALSASDSQIQQTVNRARYR